MVEFNMLLRLNFGSLRPLFLPALFGELVLGTFLKWEIAFLHFTISIISMVILLTSMKSHVESVP